MVWHLNSEVIVMVTHEVEKGRVKCHRYWPDPTSTPPVKKLQYGDIYVTHISSVPHKHFVVRTFEVFHNGETRRVKQYGYTAWPDHGVPLTTSELLGFRNAVKTGITDPLKPQIVHCSAGVGRTGTYIAIDQLIEQALDMGGQLDIDGVVKEMRLARNFMVQTVIQYMFIHRATLDGG
jgi:protein tyrosine phosphatase